MIDAQTLYFGMLGFVFVLLVLNEVWGHQEAKRTRARRNAMLHIDPAKTAGGHIGKYQTSGFGDQVYWQADRELRACQAQQRYDPGYTFADRELEVPPDAVTRLP